MKIVLLILCGWMPLALFPQSRYDIIIDEIMADPSPSVGLPGNEWIELRNASSYPINLQGWRIGDASSQSGPMPAFVLQPDSFVIVSGSSAQPVMSVYGNTISVTGFPSLDNDGDLLYLKSNTGVTIHAMFYSLSWYDNDLKKEGGWTLEMIDVKVPCRGASNWKASMAANGGTPGKINSVDGRNDDIPPVRLINSYTTDSATVILVFDDPVDSLSASATSHYSIDGGIHVTGALPVPPLFSIIRLRTDPALHGQTSYNVAVNDLADCGNQVVSSTAIRTGLPDDPLQGEWVINEILFNPKPGGYDYVEFYNNSNNKIFDAARLYIANRNSSGMVGSPQLLSKSPRYIFPGEYLAITEDTAGLGLFYVLEKPGNVVPVSPMPSFPDDKGVVVALNQQGMVVDELRYRDDWHFRLISNAEGVSLERVDPGGVSQDPSNWHSASSTSGYGTPGYRNSQFKPLPGTVASLSVSPATFSPDNDGFDDMATIQYRVGETGFVANVIIFNSYGIAVRHLVRNGIMGSSGYWNWDGLDNNGRKLPAGIYVVFTEIFNLQGRKEHFKNAIVLAGKLN